MEIGLRVNGTPYKFALGRGLAMKVIVNDGRKDGRLSCEEL